MNKNYFAPGAVYNDNHREITINGVEDATAIVRSFMSEEMVVNNQPADSNNHQEEDEPYSPPIPQERKYTQVREYIVERKKYDPEFKQFCETHSLRALCSKLTQEFGWYVDENSLGQNLNRHL